MTEGRVATGPAKAPAIDEHTWPDQGHWTYQDYLRLPNDGRRYEIIKGLLYTTNAPSFDHQFIVSQLNRQIGSFAEEHQLGIVLTALFEVHLVSSQ
jgi:hypothetical protein